MHSYAEPSEQDELPSLIPCSQSQKRFWFETRLDPNNAGLNVAVRWRLEGDIIHAHLEEAWRLIVARHQTLRTAFATIGGEPRQRVEPRVAFCVPLIDLTQMSDEAAATEAERLASLEAKRTFDITRAPLIRVTHIRVRSERSMILVTAHHTVCDGWSVGILAAEMGEICAALGSGRAPELPELSLTYADYAAREQGWLAAARGAYRDELAERWRGFEQFEVLPDNARPPFQTTNGEIVSELLDRELTDALAELARKNRCTLFMVTYAALLALLHRYSGQTDITIGTQFAGREEVEFERLVGAFVNTVALRTDVDGDPTFAELLERVRDTVTDAYELRVIPLEELIEIVNPKRDLSRNALFSINFIFQRSFIKNETYGSFRLIDLPSRSAGPICDLNFFMVERPEGWRVSCEFNADLYRQETVERLLRRWIMTLRAAARDSSQPIGSFSFLLDDERRMLAELNETTAEYPGQTVHDLITSGAAGRENKTAVRFGKDAVTYGALQRRVHQMANYLHGRVGAGRRIAVCVERSVDLVVALLATLEAGCSYVPLDAAHPRARLKRILENAGVAAMICDGSADRTIVPNGVEVIDLSESAAAIASMRSVKPDTAVSPHDPAYVIYTSGSTGEPKGVEIAHASVVNLLTSMERALRLHESDMLMAVTTVSFDIAALELFLPLVVGGTVIIASRSEVSDVVALMHRVEQSGVTIMQATPALWSALFEAGFRSHPGFKMLCGGEALPRTLADQLLVGGGELWNVYGPTETTIWSSCVNVEADGEAITVGKPISNTQFYVLDGNDHLVPPGVVGQLHIAGDGVALGYVGRPELTSEKFVANPFGKGRMYRTGDLARVTADGQVQIVGRLDHQIKLRGFRIELGEIESVLSAYSGVSEAAAVIGTESSGGKAIWAYVVPRGTAPKAFDVQELRTWLKERLPAFMLPSAIVALTSLPLSPAGKVDRRALPPPERQTQGGAYHGPTEERLGSVLAELLGVKHVDRDVDIFALGFHSLLAVRFTARVKEMFGFEFPLRVLFENPTIGSLATYMDNAQHYTERPALQPIVTLNAGGSKAPFVFFHSDLFADGLYARQLAAALGPDQPIHSVAPHGTSGLPLLPTIESMASDYASLIRSVQPTGPYRLGGYCAGGLVAYELARLLRSQGEVVDRLVLMNASPMPSRRIGLFDAMIRQFGS
ncbi:MAG TPA: amino acid adenylation domain-containing protein, partial [Candidatus Aquilonibacter sp.]